MKEDKQRSWGGERQWNREEIREKKRGRERLAIIERKRKGELKLYYISTSVVQY